MGAISSDGLFDVTLTVRVAARSEDATCPTCALARTFGASPDDARFDVTCLSCSCGVTTIARQARTIRRLFTAYFLAKAGANRWRKLYQGLHAAMGSMDAKAEEAERARIVAALRREASDPAMYQDKEAYIRAADAIERGEL